MITRCSGSDVEVQDADVGEVVDVGQAGDVGHHGAATDVEEDPVGLEHLVVDPDGVRSLEPGVPADQRAALHAVEPGLDAVPIVEHDGVLARLDLCDVDRDLAGADTVLGAASGHVCGVRAGDQRLGRNAAVVDARAADELALDHCDGLPCGGQPAGEWRARLAGADDDGVEFACHGRQVR